MIEQTLTISPQENEPPANKSEKKFSRRTFVKSLITAAAVVMAERIAHNIITTNKKPSNLTDKEEVKLQEKLRQLQSKVDEQKLQEKIAEIKHKLEVSQHQKSIEIADDNIIGQTFEQQITSNQSITLNKETRQAIYANHRKNYEQNYVNYRDGLIGGLKRMKPWVAEIKNVFSYYNVPEEFMYLAIAESHFDIDAVSSKAAVGPYQITKSIAKKYNLTVTDYYDERRDPIKSAEVCAKHLRDSYETFGHNWDLALMDYNGGWTNKFIKHIQLTEQFVKLKQQGEYTLKLGETLSDLAIKYQTSITLLKRINKFSNKEVRRLRPGQKIIIPQKRNLNFKIFNSWLEERINNKLNELSKSCYHYITTGDTLSNLAQKYNTTPTEIKLLNHLNSDKIILGQKILIPPKFKQELPKILHSLSDYRENINYPEKFHAIIDIIRERHLDTHFNEVSKKYKEITLTKRKFTKLQSYKIKKGDTIDTIAKIYTTHYPKYALNTHDIVKMLQKQNNISNINDIRVGQILNLKLAVKKQPTLSDIAKKYKIDLEKLAKANLAITHVDYPIPENVSVRIPTKA